MGADHLAASEEVVVPLPGAAGAGKFLGEDAGAVDVDGDAFGRHLLEALMLTHSGTYNIDGRWRTMTARNAPNESRSPEQSGKRPTPTTARLALAARFKRYQSRRCLRL